MKILLVIVALLSVNMLSHALEDESISKSICKGRICVEDGTIDLTDDDINDLNEILREDELPDHKYQVVTLKSVIAGSVYLLSARKPDYYGIQIVLSKEGAKWVVLKKVKSTY